MYVNVYITDIYDVGDEALNKNYSEGLAANIARLFLAQRLTLSSAAETPSANRRSIPDCASTSKTESPP